MSYADRIPERAREELAARNAWYDEAEAIDPEAVEASEFAVADGLFEAREGRRHRHGPSTERASAAQAAPRTGSQRRRALEALVAAGERGLTDYELHDRIGTTSYHVAGTRRGELVHAGLAEATERKRLTPNGAEAIVWRATAAGARVLDTTTREGA